MQQDNAQEVRVEADPSAGVAAAGQVLGDAKRSLGDAKSSLQEGFEAFANTRAKPFVVFSERELGSDSQEGAPEPAASSRAEAEAPPAGTAPAQPQPASAVAQAKPSSLGETPNPNPKAGELTRADALRFMSTKLNKPKVGLMPPSRVCSMQQTICPQFN
jgi:hypothetical protein